LPNYPLYFSFVSFYYRGKAARLFSEMLLSFPVQRTYRKCLLSKASGVK